MKTKLSQNITYWLGVAAIGLVVGLSLQFVRAWTEPSVAPPGGNVGAPINTSINPQTKAGGLGVTQDLTVGGNVGIGTTEPKAKVTIDTNNPSYSASQLSLNSRDITTSANENLYVNHPNNSGNLMVGGEGENKDICAWRDGAWKCLSAAGGGVDTTWAWGGLKWVPNLTQISCGDGHGGIHYARVNNGKIEIRVTHATGAFSADSGWVSAPEVSVGAGIGQTCSTKMVIGGIYGFDTNSPAESPAACTKLW